MSTGHSITLQASISESSAATNEIVAAVTGKAIVVDAYVLVAAGAVDVNWEDGTTDISGVMSLPANGDISLSGGGLLRTTKGNALQLTLGGAVQVSGHLSYHLE